MSTARVRNRRNVSFSTAPGRERDALCARSNSASVGVPRFLAGAKPKLLVGATDDPAEAEADQMADAVLKGGVGPSACSCGPDSGGCAKCRANGALRREAESGAAAPASSISEVALGPGSALSAHDRSFFEPRMGDDLSQVRIHDEPRGFDAASDLGARAFALGNDIVFGRDQYQPHTESGRGLLAHELAHLTLGHSDVARRASWAQESAYERNEERRIERERKAAEKAKRHAEWTGSVDAKFGNDLANQSQTLGAERDNIALAMIVQRAAVIDAAAGGEGWLVAALAERGYTGPGLADLKARWAGALIAAEALTLNAATDETTTEGELGALDAIPAFYVAAREFCVVAEAAHTDRVTKHNTEAHARYETALADYNHTRELDKIAQGPAGEPGEKAARGAVALMRGDPPSAPVDWQAPPVVSSQIDAVSERVYAAETAGQWKAVAGDVTRVGNAFTTLITATLPENSDVRVGLEYMEQLDTRLADFEDENPTAVRIPAVFYPEDKEGPETIPWQFYLTNDGVDWVLTDVTSPQRFQNRSPTTGLDASDFNMGAVFDPPVEMFSALNSRLRFPNGRLYFTLPSGTNYVLRTTEPWSLSDWLSAIGMALAAIAITASIIATGGASAPAAVAFYAGLGAAAFGIGATLANLHERSQQGILSGDDVDKAMISIGIDLLTMGAMGLGRLVALPAAAAKIGLTGERFILLQRATQVVRAGVVAGDVYQAWSFTRELIQAFKAIDNQKGLTDEERDRMRGQLIRRALLTGALLTIAIRGDVKDYQAGRTLQISHVDPDGVLVPVHSGEPPPPHADDANPHPDATAPGTARAAAGANAEVSKATHANADAAGGNLAVGPQSHALAAGGSGKHRDFYFCSDLCAPIVDRLAAIVSVLPRNHPERKIFEELLKRARGASRRLKAGKLTPGETDAIAQEISADIARHSDQSELFGALMNTEPVALLANKGEIKRRLAAALDVRVTHSTAQGETQAANRGSNRGRDPLEERDPNSPLEMDVLGGINVQDVAKPGKKAQPLHFDTGNFSHTHGEALVPGLPRGLSKEVPVTLPDGSVGRADRVRFITDADGDVIGAHVYEIKPDTPDNVAAGERQAQEYRDGLQAEIEAKLREKGKAIPTSAPDGGQLYGEHVMTYDYTKMMSVLRALRASKRDAARLAELEAIARQVFAGAAP